MKTYTIERRKTIYETIEVKADSRQQAIKDAETAPDSYWTGNYRKPNIDLISIS